MCCSKGDLMKMLGMTTGVDSALPIQFVEKLKKLGFERYDVLSQFVMDYRDGKRGDFTPLTVSGYKLLLEIEEKLGWDMPKPEKVVDLETGEVVPV